MYLLDNLRHIIEHKYNYFKLAIREGMILSAFSHDLSKLYPSEFIPYAKEFYGDNRDSGFEKAWFHHYKNNKHHWQYWMDYRGNPVDIPDYYIDEMILDWKAMGIEFGDTAKEYYLNNKDKIKFTEQTREKIEDKLEV